MHLLSQVQVLIGFTWRVRDPALTPATCLQIKSLDKKLRKLEVAMSTAKDDPSMVYAKWGDNDSASSYSSTSPTPVSDDASMASTPRQAHDSSPSPSSRLSPVSRPGGSTEMASQGTSFCTPVPVRVQNVVTSCKAGEPVKLELSLSHSMLQSVACGMDNITFVMQGGEARSAELDTAASSGTFASSLMSASASSQETAPVPAVKIEPGVESASTSFGVSELSDEDIIAMLAQCAGSENRNRTAPQIPDTTASLHEAAQALSDVEIMQALAGCCEVPHSFSYDHDNEAHQLPRLLSSKLLCDRRTAPLRLHAKVFVPCAPSDNNSIFVCMAVGVACMHQPDSRSFIEMENPDDDFHAFHHHVFPCDGQTDHFADLSA
jgi:hypothetical protein